jgi:16S rRNA (uracil1498-N3)-methyltransferase
MAHRFHIDRVPETGRVTLPRDVVRHLHVLKVTPGEEVTLFDGTGREARVRIERVGAEDAEATVLRRETVSREGPLALTLGCAVPKGRRMDTLVRMVAELGVRALVPMLTARSVVKPHDGGKLERWRKICVAAAEQSGRNVLMSVTEPATLAEVLERAGRFDLAVMLSPGEEAPTLPEALRAHPRADSMLVLVGPEGGFTDEELTAARESGCTRVRLTPSTLRIETAAVTAAALVLTQGPG